MATLAERLAEEFEERICRVCVHRTADGGCTLTERRECPIYQWAEQIAAVVEEVRSDRLAEYADRIQEIICPACFRQRGLIATPETVRDCEERTHLDCPLDLYLGLIVPIVEEELRRTAKPEPK